MTHDELQELWDNDSKIDPDDLHLESLRTPILHSKYAKIHTNLILLKKKTEADFKKIRLDRWKYYSGKADKGIYVDDPFDHKILKQDVDKYLDADDKIIAILTKIDYVQVMIDYCESVLKQISNRTYQIKNSIDYMKYLRGE